jgi:isopenicillin N synthase-like dioxygenase
MAFETLDPENQTAADTKEHFQMGEDVPEDHPDANLPLHGPNQWPAEVQSAPRALSVARRLSCMSQTTQ